MKRATSPPVQNVLNVWAVVLFIWSIYRYTFKMDLPIWVDEFIAKPVIFFFPIVWYIRQKKKAGGLFEELGFKKTDNKKDVYVGFAIGILFIIFSFLFHTLKHNTRYSSPSFSVESGIWVVAMICAAFAEQVLSTGFALNQLLKESGRTVWSVVVSALLFFFIHIPTTFSVSHLSGSVLLQTLTLNIIVSLLTSVVFLMRKNTLSVVIIQAAYFLSLPILL